MHFVCNQYPAERIYYLNNLEVHNFNIWADTNLILRQVDMESNKYLIYAGITSAIIALYFNPKFLTSLKYR